MKSKESGKTEEFVRELPIVSVTTETANSNCAPCLVGKTLGRRECPGLKARRLVVTGLRRLAGFFKQ